MLTNTLSHKPEIPRTPYPRPPPVRKPPSAYSKKEPKNCHKILVGLLREWARKRTVNSDGGIGK